MIKINKKISRKKSQINKQFKNIRYKTHNGYSRHRNIADAEISIKEIIFHSFANFLYGLTSGLVIVAMIIGNLWVILILYLIHKKNEVKTIPRMQYKSKLGKSYLYPIPSTLGYLCSYLLGEWIKTII